MKKTAIGFVVGALAGSVATWYLVKKKYEMLAQEEIEAVRDVYQKRAEEYSGEEESKDEPKTSINVKPDIQEYAKNKKTYVERTKTDYTSYSKTTVVEEEDKEEEEDQVDTIESEDDDEPMVRARKPYVISPDEFMELGNYEAISLTYYADNILADDEDEIIEDYENTIGEGSLDHFGEYEDDSVFVRNDALKCDYEILRDQRRYSDIVLRNARPHQLED